MKKFITEIWALNWETNSFELWAGPVIEADTLEEAKEYCDNNGLGYCKVIGEQLSEEDYSTKLN